MDEMGRAKTGSTKKRWDVAMKDKAYDLIRESPTDQGNFPCHTFSRLRPPGELNRVETPRLPSAKAGNPTKAVWDFIKSGKPAAYVITVCDETSAERCPIFPGVTTRLHWSFPDPSSLQGTPEEKLAKTLEVRDTIQAKIDAWCEEICPKAEEPSPCCA